jgi:hypothetical protein
MIIFDKYFLNLYILFIFFLLFFNFEKFRGLLESSELIYALSFSGVFLLFEKTMSIIRIFLKVLRLAILIRKTYRLQRYFSKCQDYQSCLLIFIVHKVASFSMQSK